MRGGTKRLILTGTLGYGRIKTSCTKLWLGDSIDHLALDWATLYQFPAVWAVAALVAWLYVAGMWMEVMT